MPGGGSVKLRGWLIVLFVVFFIPLPSRSAVTVVFGGVLFLLFWLNFRPLLARTRELDVIDVDVRRRRFRRPLPLTRPSALAWPLLALVAFIAGLAASARWAMFQQFLHARPFGMTDPIFGKDIGL